MRQKYGPDAVERAIEDAIAALRRGPVISVQIADLDDAVDAYRSRAYGVAMVLARAASEPLPAKIAPTADHCARNSLDEIRSRFHIARLRRTRSALD